MKSWSVNIPVAGYLTVEVEGPDNSNEAIKKGIVDVGKLSQEELYALIEEIDVYEKLVEGNVVNVNHYKAEAQYIEDSEE